MSRHRVQRSEQHHIERMGHDDYRISWVVDRYYAGSRLRFPTRYSRDTDAAGARRFARKWKINVPSEPQP